MFALYKDKPTKKTILLSLPNTASNSSYAVQVTTNDFSPYCISGQYIGIDPQKKIHRNAFVLINTLDGDNHIGRYTSNRNNIVKVLHPTKNESIEIEDANINFIHTIIGVFNP